jgi:hypothetical protein
MEEPNNPTIGSDDVTSQEKMAEPQAKPEVDNIDWQQKAIEAQKALEEAQKMLEKTSDKEANFKNFREKTKAEKEQIKSEYEAKLYEATLYTEVTAQLGVKPPQEFLKLIDRDKVSVSDDGLLVGVNEEIERIREMFSVLAPKPKGNIGINPDSQTKRIYTKQELADPVFVAKNLKDLELAQKEGRIQK